jgi:NAD(P)-dependent dehydrogenase (short-subunit alcohol dehydrogenase family)
MTSAHPASETRHQQDLLGQTVVVFGGSSGIGLETARLARARGADVVLAARDPNRLQDAAQQVNARSTAALDATDLARLERFFEDLPGPIDHVMVTGPGPYYSTLRDMDFAEASRDIENRLLVTLAVARFGAARMRPPGTLLFIGGTGGRRPGVGLTLISALTNALPALIANLALELAPIRANLHRRGLRRYALVRVDSRRPARGTPRGAPRHAAHRPRRRTGRRRGAGGSVARNRGISQPV